MRFLSKMWAQNLTKAIYIYIYLSIIIFIHHIYSSIFIADAETVLPKLRGDRIANKNSVGTLITLHS